MKRQPAVVVVGDLHANSSAGLMPPAFTLDDGNVITPNASQAWLWARWLEFWQTAAQYEIEAVIVNGDAPQGINARDAQTLTVNESDQVRMALATLEPLQKLQQARKFPVYATRGTGFHSGGAGSREETIWREFGAVADDAGRRARWALWLNWRGKIIHATHHVSTGYVYPHTALMREMRGFAEKSATAGYPLPDVDVRSHVHRCHSLEHGGRWMVTAPAWQMQNEFGYRVAPASVSDIGGLILWLDERNDVQLRKLLYRQPAPKPSAVRSPSTTSSKNSTASARKQKATASKR